MAQGILASNDLSTTGVDIQVYQVTNTKSATFTIRVTNRSAGTVHITLALVDSGTPTDKDYIVWNQAILPGDVYTEPGVVLGSQNLVFAQTDTSNVNVVIWGFEEAAS